MLRVLHTADVHLGARHADLGEQAAGQRERQFAAFRATIEFALNEKVDLFLIAGDLFDSNTQPRRSVERVAAELKRLALASIRTVILPGTHDVYDRASIYRAYDLAAIAGVTPQSELIVVLSPDQPNIDLPILDVVVYGRSFATKRAPHSPLAGFHPRVGDKRTWRIGMIHGSLSIPDKTDRDEVVFTPEEIAASGLDYLALGHWHSTVKGRSGRVIYAYPGAPEPIAVDQDRAGNVLLVTLDQDAEGAKTVDVMEHQVGRTRFEKLDIDAGSIANQPALVELLKTRRDPNLILDARITGVRPDELDLDLDEVEAALAPQLLKIRVRDASMPALSEGALPPTDTILGAFIRDVEGRIAELEAADRTADATELRDALRLGRLLLTGHEVTL